ncbi:MAG: hypothetical protein ACYTHM_12355 [Planctomycetota bacterium]|jgi:hypothetical protein
MSASARLLKPKSGSVPAALGRGRRRRAHTHGKKGFTYRGICITCGEKILITAEKMEIAYFAFCNAECKARFDAEMNEEID